MDAVSAAGGDGSARQSRQIHGEGTPERDWIAAIEREGLPFVGATELVPQGCRAFVLAPHPDDEVLGAGGLIAELIAAGREVHVIAVSDGLASHPGSTRWPVEELGQIRSAETAEALRRLGAEAAHIERLGLPDGALASHQVDIAGALAGRLAECDVVFTTWRLDGHPDHEAVGRAARIAAGEARVRCFEFPVWGWHWCEPDNEVLPLRHGVRVAVEGDRLHAKARAIEAFRSQLEVDPSTGQPAVLPGRAIARFLRPYEFFIEA